MAENMRYKDANGKVNGYVVYYGVADPKGTVLGGLYYDRSECTNYICPEGWVLPSNTDFSTLVNVANNYGLDEYGRFRLRAGNFWVVARTNKDYYCNYIYAKTWNYGTNPTGFEEGFNTLGFGLMGGSFYQYNYDTRNPSYNYAYLLTRSTYSGVWRNKWHMYFTNHEFQSWSGNGYYIPARCILQSTSVE